MLHVNVYEYFSPEQQKMCVITRGHFKTHIQGAEKSFQRKKYRLRLWKELYEIEIMENNMVFSVLQKSYRFGCRK